MALDKDVVNMAQAIREHETGNRAIAGGSGELKSRYQFMPATWKSSAGKYLNDQNAPLTLENENKVAYSQIKDWKDQGLNPGQIAAAWNAGIGSVKNDAWKTKVGVNSAGVKFDTPAYVRNVYSRYQKLKEETKSANLPEERPGVIERATGFIKKDILEGGIEGETGILGEIFRSTLGSRGLAGIAQMPGKVFGQLGVLKEQTALDESMGNLAELTTKALRAYETTPPGEHKDRLQRNILENLDLIQGKSGVDFGNLREKILTPRQTASTAINAALAGPLIAGGAVAGPAAILTGTGKGLGPLAIKAASKIAPKTVPAVTRAATLGKSIIPRMAENAAISAGFAVSGNLREGRPLGEGVGPAAGIGALIPAAGTVVSKLGSKVSSRMINSLIKPLSRDLAYGKNPAKAVIDEGIVGNSLEDLAKKVTKRSDEVGLEIGNIIRNKRSDAIIADATDVLKPIDETIAKLSKAPRSNSALIKRLQNTKDDLLQLDEHGVVKRKLENIRLEDLFEFKKDVDALTKFTGAMSDDTTVNKALKQVYGKTSKKMIGAAPELERLNERYANLLSAKKASVYREQLVKRQNLVSFPTKIIGGIGAITMNPIAIAAAVATHGIDKLLGSSAFKTRLAQWLKTASPEDKGILYSRIPGIKNILDRVFGK